MERIASADSFCSEARVSLTMSAGVLSRQNAEELAPLLATDLARSAYKLER